MVDAGEVAAIVMAAGFSRRMGGRDKLLLPFRGAALLDGALELVAALPFRRRLVVITAERLGKITLPPGVEAVRNPHPERGQSESVRQGVAAAENCGAYLFLPADQPLLDAVTVYRLLERAEPGRIAYPVVEGQPAMPALFPAALREELLAVTGDSGGRAVRAAHPTLCQPLETLSPLPFLDVDSEAAYRCLLEKYD